ncbi:MAG: hypothetical protein V4549_18065 [Bacteroidota bacterium]
MKTLNEINEEIKELLKTNVKIDSDSDIKKARNKLKILNLSKKYLEFNPTKESVLNQKKHVTKCIKIDSDRFKDWFLKDKNYQILNPRKNYDEVF